MLSEVNNTSEKFSRDELIQKLEEQITLLQLSAENFDKGFKATTLNMATSIRVLFHDTTSSVSLIKLLCDIDGIDKDSFKMITTKEQNTQEYTLSIFGDGLCGISCSKQGLSHFPFLSDAVQTKVPFSAWWDEFVIKNVRNGFGSPVWMSRRELIILHANKEGGAHVDKNKNIKISEIGTQEAVGWRGYTVNSNGTLIESSCIVDQKRATIRQVCYEVLVSLHNHFPKLFKRELY